MININYIEKKDTFTAMNIPSMERIEKMDLRTESVYFTYKVILLIKTQ